MSKIDYNSSLSTHRKNMKALNEKHKNELEKVRINHTKQKNQLELSQAKELVTKRSEGHKKLIDLNEIPEDIYNNIINTYDGQKPAMKMKVLNYLIKKRCNNLIEVVEEFYNG